MAERVCYKLAARSPFHFGERGVGIEETSAELHSDTLFAALCLTMRELGVNLDALLDHFPKNTLRSNGPPPFRLSSGFPYAGDVLFFPRPMLRLQGLGADSDPTLAKKLKKIRFVSKALFEAIISGQDVNSHLLSAHDRTLRRGVLLQDGQAWVTPDELAGLTPFERKEQATIRLWEEQVVQRVTVDRVTNASQVYQAGRVRFADGCGLYVLIDYEDTAWQPHVERTLRALGDAGVGGERSSGHGQFELQIGGRLGLSEPAHPNAYTTLSLYWPTEGEVQGDILEGSSYALINRRGWLGSPDGMNLRRQSVRMLAEGSIVRQRPHGALADVKPLDPTPVPNVPHDVWRYGLAFPVACHVVPGQGGDHE